MRHTIIIQLYGSIVRINVNVMLRQLEPAGTWSEASHIPASSFQLPASELDDRLHSRSLQVCDQLRTCLRPNGIGLLWSSIWKKNYSLYAIMLGCLPDGTYSHFDRTPTCDRQTDGRTDIYRACIAQRGKIMSVQNEDGISSVIVKCVNDPLLFVTDYTVYKPCYQSPLRDALQQRCGHYWYYCRCRISTLHRFLYTVVQAVAKATGKAKIRPMVPKHKTSLKIRICSYVGV